MSTCVPYQNTSAPYLNAPLQVSGSEDLSVARRVFTNLCFLFAAGRFCKPVPGPGV